MRVLAIAVCAGVLLGATATVAQTGYNGAAGCHKGFFWPFSRSKGDCLTDTEKKDGLTGNYLDPNPGAPQAPPVAAAQPKPVAPPPVAAASVPPPAPPVPPAQTAPASRDALITKTDTGGVQCTKGFFWPFSRGKGDCLTDTEKKDGLTGVYGDSTANAAPAPVQNAAAPTPAAPAVVAPAVPAAPAQTAVATPPRNPNPGPGTPAPAASSASSGGLFGSSKPDRDPGLLSDDPALSNGAPNPIIINTPAPAAVAAQPPRPAPPVAAAAAPAPQAPPVAAAQPKPAAPPVAVANVQPPAPAAPPATRDALITKTDATGVQCTKGFFWPFSRSKGDCLTDTEKKDGLTGNYLDPNPGAAPPAAVVAAPAPRPAPVAPAPVASPAPVAAAPAPQAVAALPPRPVAAPAQPASQAPVNEPDLSPAVSSPVVVASAPAARVNAPAAQPAPATRDALITKTDTGGVQCTKGFFWPFSRSKGDCLTDTEKKDGLTGNYLDPNPGAAPIPTPASVKAAPPAAPAAANDAVVTKATDDGTKCTKGIFWPFVRSAGDCQTDAEKKDAAAKNGGAQ